MSQQGERPTRDDDWWNRLYDESAPDAGPDGSGDSLDDRFDSASHTVRSSAQRVDPGAESPDAVASEADGPDAVASEADGPGAVGSAARRGVAGPDLAGPRVAGPDAAGAVGPEPPTAGPRVAGPDAAGAVGPEPPTAGPRAAGADAVGADAVGPGAERELGVAGPDAAEPDVVRADGVPASSASPRPRAPWEPPERPPEPRRPAAWWESVPSAPPPPTSPAPLPDLPPGWAEVAPPNAPEKAHHGPSAGDVPPTPTEAPGAPAPVEAPPTPAKAPGAPAPVEASPAPTLTEAPATPAEAPPAPAEAPGVPTPVEAPPATVSAGSLRADGGARRPPVKTPRSDRDAAPERATQGPPAPGRFGTPHTAPPQDRTPVPRPRTGHVGDGPPTYDAEPTALPYARPDALDELVADTVLDGARYGAYVLRAGSSRGDSARYRGEPRRDALLTARFGNGENALVLVAVAGGARTSDRAHLAAADACHWIGGAIGRSHLRLAEDIRAGRRGDLKAGLHRLTDRSYGMLRARAGELGLPPQEYTASLRCLLLSADPACRTRVFFGIGHGGLFRLRGGVWQDIEPTVPEPGAATGAPVVGFGSAPAGAPQGDRLTMALGTVEPARPFIDRPAPPAEPFRFRASVARPGDVLLLCSSGLAEPLRGESALAKELAERWARPEPPGLAAFLADMQLRVKGYADDRTAVAVWEA
ncbi:protein phosphatase 2C domain-containing protein [Streptomyces sp. NPDC048416]|uniref:protein phosphatase 2C domain-containing protein n=1 Tax=Streptomyces sp. NPDC048416 TaxID=3365546 RepID=UPI0037162862